MPRDSITIVGASLAGIRAAEEARRRGFTGRITLIGDEPHPPYDRPPLSKQVLAGEWPLERAHLLEPAKLEQLELDLRLGTRAVALDAKDHRVVLDRGEELEFDGLLVATGCRPRTLPGAEGLPGVFTLRTLDDCLQLRQAFVAGPRRVVVVGAGFIGAEVAATARQGGLPVTMVEALPVPLGRVLGDRIGSVIADIHREQGVDLRLGVGVASIEGDGRVEQVHLSDGSTLVADVVVVGIGVVPNTEWLEGSGLHLDDGVVCDETCLAAPDVAAAGDVARWPNRRFGAELMRVEHWDNAVEQGSYAAGRLLAGEDEEVEPFAPVPWFWSDQYDRKIQLAGRAGPDDDVEVVTGSLEERRFAALYGRGGRVVGVLGMNRPRHVMQYRALIEQGASWDDALAAARAQE